jgi:hypothetical protein
LAAATEDSASPLVTVWAQACTGSAAARTQAPIRTASHPTRIRRFTFNPPFDIVRRMIAAPVLR